MESHFESLDRSRVSAERRQFLEEEDGGAQPGRLHAKMHARVSRAMLDALNRKGAWVNGDLEAHSQRFSPAWRGE